MVAGSNPAVPTNFPKMYTKAWFASDTSTWFAPLALRKGWWPVRPDHNPRHIPQIKIHEADQPDLVGVVQPNDLPDRLNRRDWTASVSRCFVQSRVISPIATANFRPQGCAPKDTHFPKSSSRAAIT